MLKIIADTACDLSAQVADDAGITLVPLSVRFGEEEFVDRSELSYDDFWNKMQASTELPSTSAPSAGLFEDAYRKAHDDNADTIVVITISARLSATYQSALRAAEAMENAVDIRVIDSRTCTVAHGLLCLEAARLVREGSSVDDVIAHIEYLKARTHVFGALDTLDNLRKGGRIGTAGAFFASLLSVKPVITVKDGEVQAVARQRTRRRSIEHLVSLVAESTPVDHIAVAHSRAPDVGVLIEQLQPLIGETSIPVHEVGPAIGTHGGPRLLAVCFVNK